MKAAAEQRQRRDGTPPSHAAAAAAAAAAEAQQQQPSSSSSSSSMLSFSLCIAPAHLEQRFWARRCNSRLTSLDVLFELCNTLVWLSILPNLHGLDRAFAKASLALAGTQLAAIHLSPRTWLQRRSLLISAGLLLRCGVLLLQLQPAQQLLAATLGPHLPAAAADGPSMVVAVGFWGNLLFVLFHQQPVRLQMPLLALSSMLQAWCSVGAWTSSGSSSLEAAAAAAAGSSAAATSSSMGAWLQSLHPGGGCAPGAAAASHQLQGLSAALTAGFEQLTAGFVGDGCLALVGLGSGDDAAALLSTRLFLCLFGGFVLPCFIAYVLEWKYKVAFLLSTCRDPAVQLGVLTPAAAVVRGSTCLALLLYAGWLLALATGSWLVCCAAASAVLAAR
jgi:hypothetical protein